MKRAGFTMIELIFVIVILGILAAVALPKFAGVSDQANAAKCDAFVGTLNRTVGPSMWSASLTNGSNGSIAGITGTGTNGWDSIGTYMAETDMPNECFAASVPTATTSVVDVTSVGTLGTPQFGNSSYTFALATDGTVSEAPRWTWVRN